MSVDPDAPLEIGDEDWWRAAEQRAKRAVRRARWQSRLRRARPYIPHGLATVALIAGAVLFVQRGHVPDVDMPRLSAPEAGDAQVKLLPEQLAGNAFEGTPAEKFAEGEKGIVLPAAKPVGRHSAKRVAAALATTRRLLVLAHLDDRALLHGDARPLQRALARGYNAEAIKHRTRRDNGVNRLAPGQVLLARPRVSGTMTPVQDRRGLLTVVTSYVFVYPLRPELPVVDRADTHVVVRVDATYAFVEGRDFAPVDHGVWIERVREYWSNISCDDANRGMLALPHLVDFGDGEGRELSHRDAYRPNVPIPRATGCIDPAPSPTPPAPTKPAKPSTRPSLVA